ncbi:MAG: hypothetical protein HC882_00385 [Acidobacteria bacterium]|nr:hypothetical protein [Acidobacteriota bacterium]
MASQLRPLTRCEVPLPIVANPTIVHDFDTLSAEQGGPKIDLVSLWLNNPTANAINDVSVLVGDGTAVVVDVAASATVQVFASVPFRSALSQNNRNIRIGANGAGLVAFGSFSRG